MFLRVICDEVGPVEECTVWMYWARSVKQEGPEKNSMKSQWSLRKPSTNMAAVSDANHPNADEDNCENSNTWSRQRKKRMSDRF